MLNKCCVRFRRIFLTLVAATFLFTLHPAYGQLNGRLAEKPIGVGYLRGTTQLTMLDYMRRLGKRLEIGKSFLDSAPEEELKGMLSQTTEPMYGASWYMVQGLVPSFETIYFQEVVDAADAKRVVNGRKAMFGENSRLESEVDGLYKLVRFSSWTSDVPPGKTAEEVVDDYNKSQAANSGVLKHYARVVEKDGKKQVERGWNMTEFYRFHDSLLFSARFEELWNVDLPAKESLTSNINISNDMGAEAFFDRIPMGMKQLGWNVLSSTAGTQMQRRDDEDLTTADLRKSSLGFGLDVVKAVMFDVEQSNGWVRFATDDRQSVNAEINFETRRNSGLTKQLEEISSGASRFAAILNDDAAATLHFCFEVSEESGELPRAAATWLRKAISDATNNDQTMVDAVTHIADSLSAFGDSRTLEAFFKVGWTEQSGGVVYGGIQVDENPNLLKAIYNMATNVPDAPASVEEAISFSSDEGREVIRISLPEFLTQELDKNLSLRPTHAFVTHQNSCLWIAMGGENALEIVEQSVARCSASNLVARTPLLTARVDVDRWMSYPQDEPTGICNLLLWLDSNRREFPPGPFSAGMGRFSSGKPTPLLQRCCDLGGDRTMQFSVLGDKSGVRASLHVGEAIANYYVARLMDMQESTRTEQRKRAEELQKKAMEAEEKNKKSS